MATPAPITPAAVLAQNRHQGGLREYVNQRLAPYIKKALKDVCDVECATVPPHCSPPTIPTNLSKKGRNTPFNGSANTSSTNPSSTRTTPTQPESKSASSTFLTSLLSMTRTPLGHPAPRWEKHLLNTTPPTPAPTRSFQASQT
jgi:hypothetical protein